MIRRPPRSTQSRSSAASDVYKRQALRLEPGKNSIREALGRAEFALGMYELAAKRFRHVVGDAPDNDYAHYGLGRCLLELGRPDEARAHLRLARALRPPVSYTHLTLPTIYSV